MRRIVLLGLICAAASTIRVSGREAITFEGPLTIGNLESPTVTVHTGDFNGDGKLDLVCSHGTATVTVLFQDPQDRENWINVTLRIGSSCFFSRGGDFDGDGFDDLMVADGASTAYFVRSKGDGTFEKPIGISEARGPRWVATGDWNNDGRLDFASSNLGTNTVTIFLNKVSPAGVMSFRRTQEPPSGREHSLEALDFDGDGIRDLVLGMGSVGIEIYRGTGDGTFTFTPSNVGELSCAQYLSVGDFNNDGKDDLAPTCIDDGTAYVGISNGDGNYTRTLAAPYAAGTESSAAADLNRDGSDDLALVSAGSGQLRVYPSLGDGTFGRPLEFGPTGVSPLFLVAEDLDGDGLPDVVSADTGGKTLTVFFGREGERFLNSADSVTGFIAAREFDVDDFDHDGAPDVFLAASSLPRAYIYLHPGGSSPTVPSLTVDLLERYSSLAVADLNEDGIPDLSGTNLALDSIVISLLDAAGKAHDEYTMPAGGSPQGLATGHIDSGPTMDLAVAAQGADQISMFYGHGDGKFDALQPVRSIERPRRVTLGDINNDGRTDLAVIQPRIAAIHLQNGGGAFDPPIPVLSDEAYGFTDVAIVDLNGDGFNDVVLSESEARNVLFVPGKGDGTFGELTSIRIGASPIGLHLADADVDGLLDVTASSAEGQNVAISLNQGLSSFTAPSLYRVGIAVSAHRVVDMNQDGVPDIVAFGSTSLALRLGLRTGQPPEPPFRRGDADGSGRVEITDAISTLVWLFRGSAPLACPDGADTNDDGAIDLTDPISTLNWLFREGSEPGAPGPRSCGVDPNPDQLERCNAKC